MTVGDSPPPPGPERDAAIAIALGWRQEDPGTTTAEPEIGQADGDPVWQTPSGERQSAPPPWSRTWGWCTGRCPPRGSGTTTP